MVILIFTCFWYFDFFKWWSISNYLFWSFKAIVVLFIYYYFVVPFNKVAASRFRNRSITYLIDENSITEKYYDQQKIIKFSSLKWYYIYKNILLLKKASNSGSSSFLEIYLYKLNDCQREELISIVSSKLPFKNKSC